MSLVTGCNSLKPGGYLNTRLKEISSLIKPNSAFSLQRTNVMLLSGEINRICEIHTKLMNDGKMSIFNAKAGDESWDYCWIAEQCEELALSFCFCNIAVVFGANLLLFPACNYMCISFKLAQFGSGRHKTYWSNETSVSYGAQWFSKKPSLYNAFVFSS